MNPIRIQDRKSRHDYIRATNDEKSKREECDRALRAWASLYKSDAREIARETKYVSLLGVLNRRHRSVNRVRDNTVHLYDMEFIEVVNAIVEGLEDGRDKSILVNNYRVRFDNSKNSEYTDQDKRDAWCREWGYAPSSYSKILQIAKKKVTKEMFKVQEK